MKLATQLVVNKKRLSLIEIKITDFDDYSDQFIEYQEEIQKEVDQAGKDGYVK